LKDFPNIEISICIPSYERTEYLERLLHSITKQTYQNFEVIISDDSKTNSNYELIKKFKNLNLKYYKNEIALDSPKNWNNAIEKANYDWIKIMHDDDFFTDENSLLKFAESIRLNPKTEFFFSSYILLNEKNKSKKEIHLSWLIKFLLRKSRSILFYKNYIGQPSCILFKKDPSNIFDETFKWVVDLEFYFRYLKTRNIYSYIKEPLVTISENETQITKQVFRNRNYEIPENHKFLEKIGVNSIKNIIIFDYFWRLYRNLEIKKLSELESFDIKIIPELKKILAFQSKIHQWLLKFGAISKTAMLLCYFYVMNQNKYDN